MKCRCGHGRQAHRPTSKGRAYAQAQRREGRTYPTRQPCTSCGCRDYHAQQEPGS